MAQGTQSSSNCAQRLFASAPVRGKVGKDFKICHQGESSHPGGLGQHLGRPGRQAWGYSEKFARPPGETGLGLLPGAIRSPFRVLSSTSAKFFVSRWRMLISHVGFSLRGRTPTKSNVKNCWNWFVDWLRTTRGVSWLTKCWCCSGTWLTLKTCLRKSWTKL